MKTFLALTALVAILFVGSASATIVYTDWQSVDSGLQVITGTQTLTFNQYNLTAPLLSVEVFLSATDYSTYKVTTTSTTANFTFTNDMTVNLVAGTLGTLAQAFPNISDTETKSGTYLSPGYSSSNSVFNITPLMLSATANTDIVFQGGALTAAIAAYFSGSGTAAISTSATSSAISAPTAAFNQHFEATPIVKGRYDATVKVRYSYDNGLTLVPEPAILSLIGLGLVGLGFRNKKYA